MVRAYSRIGDTSKILLLWLSRLCFGKTAIAIILLALAVRLVFLPFKIREVKNRRALRALAPELKVIRQKYFTEPGQFLDNEQEKRFEAEIKEFYREHKLESAMPCLFTLGRVAFVGFIEAGVSASRKDARFSSGGILWFQDLTKPDPYLVLPALLVVVGLTKTNFVNPQVFSVTIPEEERQNKNIKRLNQISRWIPLANIGTIRQPAGFVLYKLVSEIYETTEDYFMYDVKR